MSATVPTAFATARRSFHRPRLALIAACVLAPITLALGGCHVHHSAGHHDAIVVGGPPVFVHSHSWSGGHHHHHHGHHHHGGRGWGGHRGHR